MFFNIPCSSAAIFNSNYKQKAIKVNSTVRDKKDNYYSVVSFYYGKEVVMCQKHKDNLFCLMFVDELEIVEK